MKAIALGNRLSRDLKTQSFQTLSAAGRLEILDAINGAIQTMDSLSGSVHKTTFGSFPVPAPVSTSLTVTAGGTEITGAVFTSDQYGATIKIEGDGIDNQVTGPTSILHPYGGASGTVSAIIYGDAIGMPEIYSELMGRPLNLDTATRLTPCRDTNFFRQPNKPIAEPYHFWVESNAKNQSPASPAVIRFYPMPPRAYRFQCEVKMAPARVAFSDLLTPSVDLPVRPEHVEQYLLPIARAILTTSELWRDPSTKTQTVNAGETAEVKYRNLSPTQLGTPMNMVETPAGY